MDRLGRIDARMIATRQRIRHVRNKIVIALVVIAALLCGSLFDARWVFAKQPMADSPFQVHVQVTLDSPTAPIAIPSGQRLVVDFLTAGGTVSAQGGTQPLIYVDSNAAGGDTVRYVFEPQQSKTCELCYSLAQEVHIYADSLSVRADASGFFPTFLGFEVSLSGHLISQ
jgi:hypothetical protein